MVGLENLCVDMARPCCGKILERCDSKSTVATVTEMPEDEVLVSPPVAARCDEQFVSALGQVLEHLALAGSEPVNEQRSTFDGVRVPSIGLQDYMCRLNQYFACTLECYVVAAVLLDRLVRFHNLLVTKRNVHRLAGVCLLVAAKVQDDVYYSNAYYASVCGVSLPELNNLELELLRLLDWRVLVAPGEYESYRAAVMSASVGGTLRP